MIQKYDLSKLTPVMESKQYKVYTLGQISDNVWKGVRVEIKTQDQVDVKVEKFPSWRVIEVLQSYKTR